MPALARLAGKRVRGSECLLNNETVSISRMSGLPSMPKAKTGPPGIGLAISTRGPKATPARSDGCTPSPRSAARWHGSISRRLFSELLLIGITGCWNWPTPSASRVPGEWSILPAKRAHLCQAGIHRAIRRSRRGGVRCRSCLLAAALRRRDAGVQPGRGQCLSRVGRELIRYRSAPLTSRHFDRSTRIRGFEPLPN